MNALHALLFWFSTLMPVQAPGNGVCNPGVNIQPCSIDVPVEETQEAQNRRSLWRMIWGERNGISNGV